MCNIVEIPLPDETTSWADEEYGIRTRDEIRNLAMISPCQTISDIALCWVKGAKYSYDAAVKRIDSQINATVFPKFDDQEPIGSIEKVKKVALAICFHGLNGQPSVWDGHVALLNALSNIDVYVPEIPFAGHISLEDKSVTVLLNRVVDWTKKHPNMPVGLLGQSRGTCFALRFETLLRKEAPSTPVHVSLTVGPLFGTSGATLAANIVGEQNASLLVLLTPVVCKELSFGSDMAKKLVGEARKPLEDGVADRDYSMYAAIIDTLVPDTGSALPILNKEKHKNKTERHYVVPDCGHNAIVTAVATKQVADFVSFVEKMTGTKF